MEKRGWNGSVCHFACNVQKKCWNDTCENEKKEKDKIRKICGADRWELNKIEKNVGEEKKVGETFI